MERQCLVRDRARLLGDSGSVVSAITVLPNGNIIVTGTLSRVGTLTPGNVALWDGASWHDLGSGPAGTSQGYHAANALVALALGGFAMGGPFVTVSGVITPCFAQWGCLLKTPVLRGAKAISNGFQFSFQGTQGKLYDVQYSTDLSRWSTVQPALPGPATYQDLDPVRKVQPRGFYRLQQE